MFLRQILEPDVAKQAAVARSSRGGVSNSVDTRGLAPGARARISLSSEHRDAMVTRLTAASMDKDTGTHRESPGPIGKDIFSSIVSCAG